MPQMPDEYYENPDDFLREHGVTTEEEYQMMRFEELTKGSTNDDESVVESVVDDEEEEGGEESGEESEEGEEGGYDDDAYDPNLDEDELARQYDEREIGEYAREYPAHGVHNVSKKQAENDPLATSDCIRYLLSEVESMKSALNEVAKTNHGLLNEVVSLQRRLTFVENKNRELSAVRPPSSAGRARSRTPLSSLGPRSGPLSQQMSHSPRESTASPSIKALTTRAATTATTTTTTNTVPQKPAFASLTHNCDTLQQNQERQLKSALMSPAAIDYTSEAKSMFEKAVQDFIVRGFQTHPVEWIAPTMQYLKEYLKRRPSIERWDKYVEDQRKRGYKIEENRPKDAEYPDPPKLLPSDNDRAKVQRNDPFEKCVRCKERGILIECTGCMRGVHCECADEFRAPMGSDHPFYCNHETCAASQFLECIGWKPKSVPVETFHCSSCMEDHNIGLACNWIGCKCTSPTTCITCAHQVIFHAPENQTFVRCPTCNLECNAIKRPGSDDPELITSFSITSTEMDNMIMPSSDIREVVQARRQRRRSAYQVEYEVQMEQARIQSKKEEAALRIHNERKTLSLDQKFYIWLEATEQSLEDILATTHENDFDDVFKSEFLNEATKLMNDIRRRGLSPGAPSDLSSSSSNASSVEASPNLKANPVPGPMQTPAATVVLASPALASSVNASPAVTNRKAVVRTVVAVPSPSVPPHSPCDPTFAQPDKKRGCGELDDEDDAEDEEERKAIAKQAKKAKKPEQAKKPQATKTNGASSSSACWDNWDDSDDE